MEECCRKTQRRFPATASRIWGLALPLMAVSALAVLVAFRRSNSPFDLNYWAWRLAFRSSGNYNSTAAVAVEASGAPENAISVDYSLRPPNAAPPPEVGAVDSPLPFVTTDNQSSSRPRTRQKFKNLHFLEGKLQQARSSIRSPKPPLKQDLDYVPTGPAYWNAPAFHRSYLEMEKQMKVYVYSEGEQPIFHNGPCGSIYSMEGNFIYKIENSGFRTKDPNKAHVFFLPFSVASIVRFVYDRSVEYYWEPMKGVVEDYIHLIAAKYPFWNRSLGFDHAMLSCHDWGPELSKSVPELFNNSIRALCNANTSEGFDPSKDVSIPEINLIGRRTKGLIGGLSPSKRSILAFFAGGVHGPIRPILLEHWENRDPDIQVHRYLPKNVSYNAMMRSSRYCICPSGYEVASPRMVEALYAGCVPVLIKDHYVPPFSDVLNWRAFSVVVPVEDIPNLKDILTRISNRQYIRMQRRGAGVRRHFEVNLPSKRYDVLHMTLHSIWLRRLNVDLRNVVEDS
ncbi:probable glycosyltransferase At5g03795 [Andrographis paniculata]|uniref:probable glycosyltransferase At5g03795 n=1 Tax=Andrographis paniculata TaxID=175694 RepID=UPI0021E77F33|nr:probable glycosyltransferase At5g03795 [Andrographis paniculata]